jgi:hypothetical protein
MNLKRSIQALFVAVIFCTAGIAETTSTTTVTQPMHELFGGTNAALTFNNGTEISVSGGYNYSVFPPLQVGVKAGYTYSKASGATVSTNALLALGVVTLNIPFTTDFADAFFVNGAAGINYAKAGVSTTDFAFEFNAGKRFLIVPSVTYRPSVGIQKVGSADLTIVVTPVEFSFWF